MKRILTLAAILIALFSTQVEAAQHKIKHGETLSGIAQQYLGRASAFKELARLNHISGPKYRIYAGKTLRLPNTSVRTKPVVKTIVVPAQPAPTFASLPIIHGLDDLGLSSMVVSLPAESAEFPPSVVIEPQIADLMPSVAITPIDIQTLPGTPLLSSSLSVELLFLPTSSLSSYSFTFYVPTPQVPVPKGCFGEIVEQVASRVGVKASLIHAVMRVESSCNPQAVSKEGARGLMQIMPDTQLLFGVIDAFDVEANLEAGAKYLKQLLKQFGDNTKFALAAYNAGPGAVQKYNGVPPYRETRAYVSRVTNWLHKYYP